MEGRRKDPPENIPPVDPKKKKTRAPKKSAAEEDGSDESKSGDKRKTPHPSGDRAAKFREGIPENEGKTSSTKKRVKDQKKNSGTYTSKAAQPKKTTWGYCTAVRFTTSLGVCPSTTGGMYTRLAETLRILQRRDTECAIRDAYNGKAEPLRSPGEFPKQGDDHGKFERHFSIDDEVPWTWDDNIKKDRPRRFVGTFWLLSDVPTYELLNYARVNLRI